MSWASFRELDQRTGLPKGSAFRAFKRREPQLQEGQDFRLLRPGRDDAEIDALRQARRVYPNSVNIVLLGDGLTTRLLEDLGGPTEGQ
ncbi:MAG TPA: hypothetical protein VLI06_10005 [Solimonas sp.]|nr:hypothetical protein [Solimonas sp.]